MFDFIRYTPDRADEWDAFVRASKNATLLHRRGYMDYHRDRFRDCSLLCYRDDALYALLPANAEGDVLCSHGGLTYGGLLTGPAATTAAVQQLFRELGHWMRGEGFRRVVYKPVPHIFHRLPAEEDLYALFSVCHARLTGRNVSSTIDLADIPRWHRDRRYGSNKARRSGITAGESDDWPAFWQVLADNLRLKYGSRPVHTLQEMLLLHERFPDSIRLFTADCDGQVLGGTVLYVTPTVVHTQYISASQQGKRMHAIDALFDHLLHECTWGTARYFDFGTSNEQLGRILVEPLIYQKEGFGGRAVCYDRYEWEIDGG